MGIVQKIKDKVAYEKESYRMSGEELERIRKEHPELFRGGKKK
jgi:hypothetical protein